MFVKLLLILLEQTLFFPIDLLDFWGQNTFVSLLEWFFSFLKI